MEEQEVKQQAPMELEEFREYLKTHMLLSAEGANRYRSLSRAIRRGHILSNGIVLPRRPFNNRANSCKRGKLSNEYNRQKQLLYEQYRKFINKREYLEESAGV